MKVLVLNCGSSSIKYKLYDMNGQKELASGGIEKIGLPDSFLKFTLSDGSKQVNIRMMMQGCQLLPNVEVV